MSDAISFSHPHGSQWPFVYLYGYELTAKRVIDLTSTQAMAFAPLIYPEQAAAFEEFAVNAYASDPIYPPGTGEFGIYRMDAEGNRVHDTSGETIYGSPYNILAPVLQVAHIDRSLVNFNLFNVYTEPSRGAALDALIKCTEEVQDDEADPFNSPIADCGTMTDFLELIDDSANVAAVIFEPVYPASNSTVLAGVNILATIWKETFSNIFPNFVSGIDIVIESSTGSAYTFTIKDGKPELRGKGDRHDHDYDCYRKRGDVVNRKEITQSPSSVTYTLSFYPREEFIDYYRTDLLWQVMICVILVMLLTGAIFMVHDYFLKRESNEKQEILDTKRKFVRFVSHEIRTPLNTVAMGLKLLAGGLSKGLSQFGGDEMVLVHDKAVAHLKTEIQDWLSLTDDISSSVSSAVAVLNDVLNYDKIESGTMRLEIGTVNILRLCRTVIKSFEVQATQSNIHLKLETDKPQDREESLHDLRVLGDEVRLTQVFRNLLSNSLKFSPSGSTITMRVSWDQDGLPDAVPVEVSTDKRVLTERSGAIQIAVVDQGVGLSTAQLKTVFGEGVQFNANRLQAGQGSGLGLSIAKGIIVLHGGILRAESEGIDCGSVFTATLPCYLTDNQSTSTRYKQETNPNVNAPCGVQKLEKKKILVVDDSMMNRKMLLRILQKEHQHHCVEAVDGSDSLVKYSECDPDEPFDCVMMDFEMPKMNGPDATKHLRELGCKALIVGVTGNVLPEDRKHFLAMGADAVLGKPLNLAELEYLWMTKCRESVSIKTQSILMTESSPRDRDNDDGSIKNNTNRGEDFSPV